MLKNYFTYCTLSLDLFLPNEVFDLEKNVDSPINGAGYYGNLDFKLIGVSVCDEAS